MDNLNIRDVPDKLHRQLKKSAKSQGRSLNSYVINVLKLSAVISDGLRTAKAGKNFASS